MNQRTDSAALPVARKPQLAYLIATAFGLGYLPVGPGTWGSLGGMILYWGICSTLPYIDVRGGTTGFNLLIAYSPYWLAAALVVTAVGPLAVWAADRVSRFSGIKDPGFVVVDEVSGQLLTYGLALAPANWKYLLLGFILFRGFDIWKPFPARQAESLPGGWGIMADDWVAGVYAALGLWLARALGL
ncbi:MAG: phosphatidylglycerophosphatase A [Candidatus Acidiferrales bacterium]